MARKRIRKPKWTMKTFYVCLGIGVLVATPFLLKKVPPVRLMKIRDLQVVGLSAIPSVGFQSILGIQKGDPLLGTWLKNSVEKVSTNPRVANVTVTRSMTGNVQVHVQERKSSALLNLDRLYYIDDAGNILGVARYDSPEALDLPVITGLKNDGNLKSRIKNAIALKTAFVQGGNSEASISELHYDALKGWILFRTGSSVSVVFGEDRFLEKVTRLVRVLRDFQGREQTLVEVDLDFADRVIVKKAELNNSKGSGNGKEG